MTLEQAIEDTERAYKESRNGLQYALKRGETKFAERCKKDAEEYEQLVNWLRELQERRKQPEIIRCKDCKHYHTDVFGQELGIEGLYRNLIVAHNACDKWSEYMNSVDQDGFCFLAERRTDAAK